MRTDKTMALTAPQFFFAQDRSLAEEAFAGDVVGIPNRGTLRIGDALTEGEDITFLGIPSFAPEILRRIRLEDAIRAKKLQGRAARDGRGRRRAAFHARRRHAADRRRHRRAAARRAGRPPDARIRPADGFDPAPCEMVRWITSDDPAALTRFVEKNRSSIATDLDGAQVFLATSVFNLSWVADRNPDIKFVDIKTTTV